MVNPEINRSSEIPQYRLDALIVPGKNVGIRCSPKIIRNKQGHLSLESMLNVVAAGKLFNKGVAEGIIFTSGHTAGNDIPSEAQAMKDLLKEIFPQVSDNAIILEEESKSTGGNAEKVSRIIKQYNFGPVGIVDVGFHLPDEITLFRRYGVNVKDENSFVAEEIVSQEAKDPTLFPSHYNSSSVVQTEITRAGIINLIYLFDRKGKFLEWIAQKTRN